MYRKGENLVFFPDSPFADWIIDRCERLFPGLNDYVTFGENPKKINSSLVKTIGLDEESLRIFSKQISRYERVIIHYHHELTAYLIELADVSSSKIIWMLWSGDLYNSPFFTGRIYLPQTYALDSVFKFSPLTLKAKVKEGIKLILNKPSYFFYKKSFKRINKIGSFFPRDVKNASNSFNKDYSHVFHGILSVNEQLKGIDQTDPGNLGDAILIGHAGVPELNHLDLMDSMYECFSGRKLMCPLSYGSPEYIKEVKKIGLEKFSDSFIPLEDYLPREEYYKLLMKSSFAVFGSLIHQGFGNIMTLLQMGMKVFLFEENPIYSQLKSLGLFIFPLDDASPEDFHNRLTNEQIFHNRTLLKELLSDPIVDEYYRNIYQLEISN